MKTLIVSPRYPLPEVSGGDMRTMHFARYFAKKGSVDIAFCGPSDEKADDENIFRAVLPLARSLGKSFRSDFVRGLVYGAPLPVFLFSASEVDRFNDHVAREDYDVIVVRNAYMAGLVLSIPESFRRRILADLDDDITASLYDSTMIGGATNPILRYLLEKNRSRLKVFEKRCLNLGATSVCTPADQERLIAADGRKPALLPNIYRSEYFDGREMENGFAEPHNLLFVGTLNYSPNVHGLCWFIEWVFPEFQKKFPDSTLTVVGRSPGSELRSVCQANEAVTLHADPENLVEFYLRCRAVIVPLLAGGGTRIKILEAALAQRPVLSTPIGAEGLALQDGDEILLFSSAKDFIRGYESLSDGLSYNRMVRRTLKVVGDRYSVEAFERCLSEVVDQIKANRSLA